MNTQEQIQPFSKRAINYLLKETGFKKSRGSLVKQTETTMFKSNTSESEYEIYSGKNYIKTNNFEMFISEVLKTK